MTQVHLQPSPLDRLDPIAQAIRWWTSQMSEMVGRRARKTFASDTIVADKKRLPRKVVILLGPRDGFTARTRLPRGSADIHIKAIKLRLPDLIPIAPADLSIATTAVSRDQDGATTYEIAMARKARLDELERVARRKGARSVLFKVDESSTVELQSRRASAGARTNLIVDAVICVALVVSAVVAVATWTAQTNAATQSLADEERSLRRAAVATEASRKAGEMSRQLVERGIMTRRGSAALEALALLNAATPDDTWWTRVRWTPGQVDIAGQSPNATSSINALSASAKHWSIELAGPLNSAPEGAMQAFEVIAKPRGTPQR